MKREQIELIETVVQQKYNNIKKTNDFPEMEDILRDVAKELKLRGFKKNISKKFFKDFLINNNLIFKENGVCVNECQINILHERVKKSRKK